MILYLYIYIYNKQSLIKYNNQSHKLHYALPKRDKSMIIK